MSGRFLNVLVAVPRLWQRQCSAKRLRRLYCFRATALVFAELRRGETGATGATSPTRKRTGQASVIPCLRLIGAHGQHQLTAALRTFTFLHSPRQQSFGPHARTEYSYTGLSTMSHISVNQASILIGSPRRCVEAIPPSPETFRLREKAGKEYTNPGIEPESWRILLLSAEAARQ